jgi:hypothetical protein
MNCGARPLAGNSYCPACAAQTTPLSEICTKCGSHLNASAGDDRPVNAKSKVASILLAVFLGFWTWLYTYKLDGWKFWVGLGANVVLVILTYVILFAVFGGWMGMGNYYNYGDEEIVGRVMLWVGYIAIASIVSFGLWLWAVIDAAIKKDVWYNNYPNGK